MLQCCCCCCGSPNKVCICYELFHHKTQGSDVEHLQQPAAIWWIKSTEITERRCDCWVRTEKMHEIWYLWEMWTQTCSKCFPVFSFKSVVCYDESGNQTETRLRWKFICSVNRARTKSTTFNCSFLFRSLLVVSTTTFRRHYVVMKLKLEMTSTIWVRFADDNEKCQISHILFLSTLPGLARWRNMNKFEFLIILFRPANWQIEWWAQTHQLYKAFQ